MNTYTLFTNFCSFLFRPFYEEKIAKISNKSRFFQSMILLFWVYAFLIVFITLDLLILKNHPQNKIDVFLKNSNMLLVIFLSIFLLPLIEECTFRLSLKFKPIYIAITSFFIQFFIINAIIDKSSFNYKSLIGIALCISLICYVFSRIFQKQIILFFNKFYFILFYFSVLSFGLVHITNYSQTSYILPFLVLPQTLAGITLGYTRAKFGFFYSYFSHGLYNASLVIPVLIFMSKSKMNIVIGTIIFISIFLAGIWGIYSLIHNTYLYFQFRNRNL